MANTVISKQARQAARRAAAEAAEALAARNRANVEDLATFFSAQERADGVDGWLAERQQALREQAAARRRTNTREGGMALRAMRDRGESLREIAKMTALSEKAVRDLIREADTAPAASAASAVGPAGNEAGPPADQGGAGEPVERVPGAALGGAVQVPAPAPVRASAS